MGPLLVYGTEWLSAALTALAISGPLINRLRARLGLQRVAWLNRWHYWLGASAAIAAMLHVLISVTGAQLAFAAEIGLWLGSVAAALIVIEAVLGATMRGMREPDFGRSRRRHLAIMTALVVAVGLHSVLNGPLAR